VNPVNRRAVVGAGEVILEARDLDLSFGETPALRGACLSVRRGEVLAVMGPSGSGKSTLLHCLAGILVPDSGEVSFEGERLDTMREGERSRLRRDRFGFVFQFGQLVPELTAEENVALPLLLGGTRREEALRSARAWFERLELDGVERHRAGEMSLDSLTGELVMGLLTSSVRSEGTTVVLVTHEPRVAAYADREVIVRDGKVTSVAGALR
jgi:putative ABC transport system ATP-binding protein